MPSALVAALAAPIRAVQAMVGPGWSGDPVADPAAVLGRARDALADVSAATRRTWHQTDAHWSGAGADGAADFMATTAAAIDGLAAHADRLSAAAGAAAAAVARAHERLRVIVDRFEARAAALEPLCGLARRLRGAVGRGPAIACRGDRRRRGAAVRVGGKRRGTVLTGIHGARADGAGRFGESIDAVDGLRIRRRNADRAHRPAPAEWVNPGSAISPLFRDRRLRLPVPDAAAFGDGVAIRLPDGSTAMAPNAVAAGAVRHALTQLGVPYDWGGTTPGVGLDCSGLTQWAYHEAGLNIPRLAQEQDIGAAVDAGALRPGDLAVWDGHVAMIVGNGTMIEAGDPVQLSPIRTTNAGQGFQGFWRPTA